MPARLVLYLTGGADNADPRASLGGLRSHVPAPVALWDDLPAAACVAGRVDYRAVDLVNEGNQGALGVELWTAPAGHVEVGLPLGQTQALATRTPTEPPPDWSRPWVLFGAVYPVPILPPGAALRVWLQRTTPPGATRAELTVALHWRYR